MPRNYLDSDALQVIEKVFDGIALKMIKRQSNVTFTIAP